MKESDLAQHYSSLEGVYNKALDDVLWQLKRFFKEPRNEATSRIFNTSKVTYRTKPFDSLWRKCQRVAVASVDEIPGKVEDLLGIRLATVTKDQARALFEFFRTQQDSWFCKTSEAPKFVPYTIADKNKYSLQTGYQAYHITFRLEHSFHTVAAIHEWPVELQIMSQLWGFWADYSREYFYGRSDQEAGRLLPYNVAISKVLDSADDLMSATTELLIVPKGPSPEVEPSPRGVSPNELQEWFGKNILKYFGRNVSIPSGLFLSKIAEEMQFHKVTIGRLDEIMADSKNLKKYEEVLAFNHVGYLPPYQQILFRMLLALGWEMPRIVERVNGEMRLLGINLIAPG